MISPARAHDGRPPAPRTGFTLIELLAVIAIIGVLTAIIITVVGRARESARATQGVSNLRQIGVSLLSYAADNRNRLPYSNINGVTEWSIELSGYLQGKSTSYTDPLYLPIFQDPAAAVPGGNCHFAVHQRLMPWTPANRSVPQVVLTSVQNPAQKVIAGDVAQRANGNAARAGYNSSLFTDITVIGRNRFDDPVPEGENRDGDGVPADIRWRLRDNTAAKFLFVDGHVEILAIGQLKYRNIVVD